MKNEFSASNREVVTTTIGDLIATVTDIAHKAEKTNEDGRELARLVLDKLLQQTHVRLEWEEESEMPY